MIKTDIQKGYSTMNKYKIAGLVFFVIVFIFPGTVGAVVITFDDIVDPVGDYLADGYGGFDWYLDETNSSSSYPHNWRIWSDPNAPSATNVATNYCDGYYVGISSGTDFDFNGAYFSIFEETNYGAEASSITLAGFNDGVMVADPVTLSLSLPYAWYAVNLINIDMLTITPGTVAYNPYAVYPSGYFEYDGGWFAMDNFTYNEPVPEPSTILLMGLGLVGLAGLGRKKIRK